MFVFTAIFCILFLKNCSGNFLEQWLETSPSPVPEIAHTFCNSRVTVDGTFTNVSKISVQCLCSEKSVDCNNLNLRALPEKIFFPKGCHSASFSNNLLKDIKQEVFYSGKDIIELDLSNNEIDFISLRAFKAFPNLRRLILNHNQLWNLPYNIFNGLEQLRVLDLSYNSIKTLLPHIFEHVIELRELKLEDNPLHMLDAKLFEHLPKLEILDLESVIIQNISDFSFSFTPNLKILILADNQFRQVPTAALKYLKKLRTLDFSGNPIKEIGPGSFNGLESLTRLRIERMPLLTRIKKQAFANLTKLRELQCNDNFVLTDIEDDIFGPEKAQLNLNELSLRRNNLASIPSDVVYWKSPVNLHVDGNSFTCDCKFLDLYHSDSENDIKSQIRCNKPSKVEGHLLSTLQESDLVCEGISRGDTVLLAGIATLAICISVAVAGCFVYRKKITRENPSYFQAFKKSDPEDIVYDKNFRL